MSEQSDKCPKCQADAEVPGESSHVSIYWKGRVWACGATETTDGMHSESYTCKDNQIAALQAKLVELEALGAIAVCAACGEGIVDKTLEDAVEQILEHILTCEKHPVNALARDNDRLQAIVDTLPRTADGVVIVPGMELWHDSRGRHLGSLVRRDAMMVAMGEFGIGDKPLHEYWSTKPGAARKTAESEK